MTSTNVLREFSSHLTLRSCVQCSSTPVCNCSSDETCVESSRTCNACPTTSCVPSASTATSSPGSSGGGSNAGAIAGGVIGGIAVIAIVIFLLWWFMIRKKRQARAAAAQQENSVRHERSRSMQSIASTVLTRASNVIQIAYIPGVTNRSAPDTPGTLVPPVPPIPSTHASTAYSGDQYLFTPSDLRDSRYSNATHDRRSIATSLARSSVATTIYRNDAVVSPMPALQARAGKAAMVSVKTGNGTPSDELALNPIDAPAVPAITEAQLQKAGRVGPQLSSIVARSVVARPVNVKGSKPKVPTVTEEVDSDSTESVASHTRAKRFNNQDSKFDDSSDEDSSDDEKGDATEAMANSIQIGISPATNEGPFADAHAAGTPAVTVSTTNTTNTTSSTPSAAAEAVTTSHTSSERQRSSIGSSRMLENTIYQDPTTERSASPFDDHHEVK
ncbi:hypothetical protein UA08_06792 [Talaromyces atroroseus]|uniref:Membrane anchor Opy2 N-terminal domain-containing protein n=1 Tax=Talaromyces atroroseus TaxID=1441469 RepID=A0A225AAR4_TALAT|nr:hypothetical protein UA08_06792 [Talaromyces atroroseus]OKL57972.1 hypothetical protein UA08_06792 [Talaromyces atroroseus]